MERYRVIRDWRCRYDDHRGVPLWIRLLMVLDDEVHLFDRFMPGMAITFLQTIALQALYGTLTGMIFYWLTRYRYHLEDDLDIRRQRFE